MIRAIEMGGVAGFRLADAVSGMQTSIAQGVDLVRALAHQDDRARADIGAQIIAVGGEPAGMVDRQPRPREDLRQLGGEHFIGVEQLGRRHDLAGVVELLADCLDAVGKLHGHVLEIAYPAL